MPAGRAPLRTLPAVEPCSYFTRTAFEPVLLPA
jgi:hypothetical protein